MKHVEWWFAEETEVLGEKHLPVHSVHNKPLIGILGLNPSLCDYKPASNCLSHFIILTIQMTCMNHIVPHYAAFHTASLLQNIFLSTSFLNSCNLHSYVVVYLHPPPKNTFTLYNYMLWQPNCHHQTNLSTDRHEM